MKDKKYKIGLVNWVIFIIVILCSVLSGWLIRDEMGWTAKMPEFDTPPEPTPIVEQIDACGEEWDKEAKVITRKCTRYERRTYYKN